MKKTETEQTPVTDAELDAALAQMAEEVPPMPADFHDRWMNAVRAEAEKPAPSEEPAPEQPISIVRWTRILSVAAVFVFLIGGTLLYRNSKRSLTSSVPLAMEKREDAEAAAEPEAEPEAEPAVADAGALPDDAEEAAAEEPLMAESYMQAAAVDGAAGVSADAEAENREALKAAGAVQNAFAASKTKPAEAAGNDVEEADYAMETAEYEEAPAMEAAAFEAAEEAAMPEPTEAQTAEPTAVPTAEPTAVPTVEPEPEQTGFLPAAGAFFTDMGDFLLAALPYLLVLAVPAVIALAIRRRKNKKEN